MNLPKTLVRNLQTDLLAWFDQAKRDLPWRKNPTPYTVLVSEIMLQQTQVETVISYYHRFLQRFPTVQDLAAADEAEVLRYWAGLGYYRRAKNLHKASRAVVEQLAGRFPANRAGMLELPGIGPYTAGAVLSIAFDLPEPLVDGNVERVLARLFGLESNLAETAGKKELWETAEALVPNHRPGDFNQALMELGALVCTPAQPKCLLCPVSKRCFALKHGRTETLPIKKKARKSEKVEEAVLLVEDRGRWLLTDSNEAGIYQGLWQFPWAWKRKGDRNLKGTALRLLAQLAIAPNSLEKFHELRHGVTFRSISTVFYRVEHNGCSSLFQPIGTSGTLRWVSRTELQEEGLPAYQKSILAGL